MFGTTGILVALMVLTIVLAGLFLVRSSITAGTTGKILAFVGLCALPMLCIDMGMSFHMERSKQTRYCISCHSMETHGKSLHVANPNYLAAQHFQNHFVPPDKACYTCHSNYTIYGPLKDKLDGLRYIYMTYVRTPPKVIRIKGGFRNLACLHCHADARDFEDNPVHAPIMGSLKTNQISCISCHNTVHNASEVSHLKMWVEGDAPISLASVSPSSAPAKAEPAATAGALKAPTSSLPGGANQGKSVFDSHGCGGCHGETGGGGSGPALTHVSSQYPPAKLTALLKAPTAKMKVAGMVALTLNAADMKALVAYVGSLGGTSAGSAATPPASGSSSPASAKAEPAATAGASKVPAKSSAGGATAIQGKSIFNSHGCGGCHGESGSGGSGQALTHVSSQYPPAKLTALLKEPTAKMKAAGMAALTLNATDMKALVSYVTSLGGTSGAPVATTPASGSSPPPPAKADTRAATAPAKAPQTPPAPPAAAAAAPKVATASPEGGAIGTQGKNIYDSNGCGKCHGEGGAGGAGPALTHIASQYPPAQLTALLKAPTAKMQAAGMVALTLDAADMTALVSYLTGLGGASAASAAAPTPSGASSPAPAAKASPAAPNQVAKVASQPPMNKLESTGKSVFKLHRCADCHGTGGAAGTAAASALAGAGKSVTPASLTTMLQHPTVKMREGGMPPVSLGSGELKALVAYLSYISASKSSPQ